MREGANRMFASLELLQKEKLFEDNSVSRAEACSENDFSFRATINPSPYPSPSRGRGNYDNVTFASLESKEKIFEDDSVSRAEACSENDFSFM